MDKTYMESLMSAIRSGKASEQDKRIWEIEQYIKSQGLDPRDYYRELVKLFMQQCQDLRMAHNKEMRNVENTLRSASSCQEAYNVLVYNKTLTNKPAPDPTTSSRPTSKMEERYEKMRAGTLKPASKGPSPEQVYNMRYKDSLSVQQIMTKTGLSRSSVYGNIRKHKENLIKSMGGSLESYQHIRLSL